MNMERLTDTTANKCCYDTWDLCGLDSVCKRDCWKPTPCKIPKIVDRLTQYEDTGFSPSDIADMKRRLLEATAERDALQKSVARIMRPVEVIQPRGITE